jgi:hypothetical protein
VEPPASASATAAPEPPRPTDDTAKPTGKAREVVTAPDTLFLLAFESCDVGKAAAKKCAEKSGNDPKAERACVEAAREKIAVNAMGFKQDAAKKWWWRSMHKKGKTLSPLHKVMFTFGEETDQMVVIMPVGSDQAMGTGAKVPREVKIEVPNDYTIAIEDPQFGKLFYEAKIGLEAK